MPMATTTTTETNGAHLPPAQNLRADLERDGFVIIPAALKDAEIKTLREACSQVTEQARVGNWPYVRTWPKQFPPWPKASAENPIWGVQHLLHPDMPFQELFARSYFSDTIIAPIEQILECSEDELVMELYNMLVRSDKDFALRWHRDDVRPEATTEEEIERLKEPAWHAQWNLALYDDHSLVVVPGTHKRPRTETERNADPYEAHLPGMKVVELKAGDLMFYNNNILHRGVYDRTVERLTLHGTMGHVNGNVARARNVLQHGVGEWVGKCDFSKLDEPFKTRAEGMRRRLFEMGRKFEKEHVGFSQPD